jgi:hypothetical protein
MIRKGIKTDAPALAVLHMDMINKGFLVKLGFGFMKVLYQFLLQKEIVFVSSEHGTVNGFVSCTMQSKGIIKRFVLHSPHVIFLLLFVIFRKPSLIKPVFETSKAPEKTAGYSATGVEIPEVELLSICVAHKAQRSGTAALLLGALEDELKRSKVKRYKVIAGEQLVIANNFYLAKKFVLSKNVKIHEESVSNILIKEIE